MKYKTKTAKSRNFRRPGDDGEPVWYRADDTLYAGGGVHLEFREFSVVKETPKSVWLRLEDGSTTCRRKHTNRPFAHPTKEGAVQAFHARKRRQIFILEAKLERAKVAEKLTEAKPDGFCWHKAYRVKYEH